MVKNKKAIEALVATVLLVLITIAAVGLIWGAIMPIIKKNIETSQKCNDVAIDINMQGGYTYVTADGQTVSLQVSRGPSSVAELSGIQIKVVNDGGNSNATKNADYPAQNTDKVYTITMASLGLSGKAKRVGIAPILKLGNLDYMCPMKETDLTAA